MPKKFYLTLSYEVDKKLGIGHCKFVGVDGVRDMIFQLDIQKTVDKPTSYK